MAAQDDRKTVRFSAIERGAADGSAAPRLLMTEGQAAAVIGLSPRFLQARRYRGDGPQFVRISSRCVRYRPEDLDTWVRERVRASTSES
jgi:predicted DNA-binding transcriptional regulator AlpA